MRLFPCAHKFDAHELHRFTDEIVAGLCWKCDRVFTANCGLHLPGTLADRPKVCCPQCAGTGKVHALTVSASGDSHG